MIPIAVYSLCILTCLACAFLLWRGFRGTGSRLLMWSALCFLILGVSNLLLFADLIIYPDGNLSTLRNAVTLAGLVTFLVGLVFESK
jgi:hypothetical protein